MAKFGGGEDPLEFVGPHKGHQPERDKSLSRLSSSLIFCILPHVSSVNTNGLATRQSSPMEVGYINGGEVGKLPSVVCLSFSTHFLPFCWPKLYPLVIMNSLSSRVIPNVCLMFYGSASGFTQPKLLSYYGVHQQTGPSSPALETRAISFLN